MKVALVAVSVLLAFAAGWWVRGTQESRPAPTMMTAAERAQAQARVEQCRDECEQHSILQKLSDEWLRTCRASCAPPREYQPIGSITRAAPPLTPTAKTR